MSTDNFIAHQLFVLVFFNLPERDAHLGRPLAVLVPVGFIDQEGHTSRAKRRILLQLIENVRELLLRRHDDGLWSYLLLEIPMNETVHVFRLRRQSNLIIQMNEFRNVILNVLVQRLRRCDNKHRLDQLLVRSRLEQRIKFRRQPANGQRLAAAGSVLGQILLADVTLLCEIRRNVRRNLLHAARLMKARINGECRTRRILLRLGLFRNAHKEKGNVFQQILRCQHLVIKELHRIFILAVRLVDQPLVMPSEIIRMPWIRRQLHFARICCNVSERMLEYFLRVIAFDELLHGRIHGLVLLMLQLKRDNR